MPQKIDFRVVRFLVVDAHPMMQEMLRDVLMVLGAETVFRAANVAQAVRYLREDQVDVMITESSLGSVSGFELVDFVRLDSNSPNRIMPIIMLTADADGDRVQEARDHGVTEFLAKPFTVDSLYQRLVSAVARPRSFINADGYFGPDRRRKEATYQGAERRADQP